MILLDANTLLRLTNKSDPDCQRTQRVIFQLRTRESVVIASQSIYEFWAVATRAKSVNGIGMDVNRARSWTAHLLRMFPLLPEPAAMPGAWTALVEKYNVKGFRAHDARYVSLMQFHGVDKLLTYNVKDFAVFPITVIDPRTII